jgi:MFS family permease
LAWASSVYLPTILAEEIAHDLGVSANWIFAAYSAARAVAAVLGPRVGRKIDRVGGHCPT